MFLKKLLFLGMPLFLTACQVGQSNPSILFSPDLIASPVPNMSSSLSQLKWTVAKHFVPQNIGIGAIFQTQDSQMILVATRDPFRIYRSLDQGQKWVPVLTESGYQSDPIRFFSGATSKFIQIGTEVYFLSQSELFLSHDQGLTWQMLVWPELPGKLLALQSLPGKLNALIAGTDKGLFLSLDHGNNWSVLQQEISVSDFEIVNQTPLTILLKSKSGFLTGHWPFKDLKPLSMKLNFGTYSSFQDQISLFTGSGDEKKILYIGTPNRLYRSEDQGLNWQEWSPGIWTEKGRTADNVLQWIVESENSRQIHAVTLHAIFSGQAEQILTDKLSLDLNPDLRVLKTSQKWFIGGGDERKGLRTWDGKSWQLLNLRQTSAVPTSWAASQGQMFSLSYEPQSDGARHVFRWDFPKFSSDYLATAPLENSESTPFDRSFFAVSPHNPALWFLHGREGLYRTEDSGKTWTVYSEFKLSNYPMIGQSQISFYFDQENAQHIYASIQPVSGPVYSAQLKTVKMNNGAILFSSDAGRHWNYLLDPADSNGKGPVLGTISSGTSKRFYASLLVENSPTLPGIYSYICDPQNSKSGWSCWQKQLSTESLLVNMAWHPEKQVFWAKDETGKLFQFRLSNGKLTNIFSNENALARESRTQPISAFPTSQFYLKENLDLIWESRLYVGLAFSSDQGVTWIPFLIHNEDCCKEIVSIEQVQNNFVATASGLSGEETRVLIGH